MANAVKEFLTLSSSADLSDSRATNNTSPTKGTNSLEVGLQKSYRQLLDEGRRKIVEFYSDCTADLLPKLFNLYPMDNRVAELAVTLMKGQVSAQMAMMISHLKAYGLRKLKEAYTLTVKQHSKGPNKNVLSVSVLNISKEHTYCCLNFRPNDLEKKIRSILFNPEYITL